MGRQLARACWLSGYLSSMFGPWWAGSGCSFEGRWEGSLTLSMSSFQTPVCIMSLACHHQPKWKGQRLRGWTPGHSLQPTRPTSLGPLFTQVQQPPWRGQQQWWSWPARTFRPPGKGSAGGSERCLRASLTPTSRPRKPRCLKTWTQRLGCTSVSAPTPGTYPSNSCKFLSGLNIGSIFLTRGLSGT